MSFDFQLGWACRHLTIEEVTPLGSDRRSLETRQPISSANQVRVTANNNVNIPREGKFAPASLSSSFSGPFNMSVCTNTVTIKNRTQGVQDVTLPTGMRVTTDQLVTVLTTAFKAQKVQVIAENRNGALVLTDQLELGPSSRIQVTGTAAAALGFVHQKSARGRQVYPGWEMAERSSITNLVNIADLKIISIRYPRFLAPIKGNPVFKVSYATYIQRCRRCRATGIENDVHLAVSGEPITIRNENLLNQGVLKMVITRKGSNPFHPELGSTIIDRIGSKATGAVRMSINEDVTRAVMLFQRLQGAQGKVQEISLKERLYSVLSVTTNPGVDDPTVVQTNIVAQNASGQPVFISTVFAAPGAAALVGTNGLSLGLAPLGLPGF